MDMIEEVKKILMSGEITVGPTVETARTGRMFVFDAKRLAKEIDQLYEPQAKKLLLSISKESKKLDGTTYLVPDYTKFREAIKRVGIREETWILKNG